MLRRLSLRPASAKSLDLAPPVQRNAIEAYVLKQASAAALRGKPASNESVPDATERRLEDDTRVRCDDLNETANNALRGHAADIHARMPALIGVELEVATTSRDVEEVDRTYSVDVRAASDARWDAWLKLAKFEADNELQHLSAVYSTSWSLSIAVAVAMVVVEASWNTYSLQDVQANGLLGGLWIAGGGALVNVVMGFAMGHIGWRNMFHVSRRRRQAGLAVTAICATLTWSGHLALAHLRENVSMNPDARLDLGVVRQPDQWFAFTTMQPVLLLALGVIVFLLAARKGFGGRWGCWSTYPGHDAVDARFRQADEELVKALENNRAVVADAFDAERVKVLARHEADGRGLVEIRRISAEAHGVARTHADAVRHAVGRLFTLKRLYRERNMEVRALPPPAYFTVYPTVREFAGEGVDLTDIDRLVACATAQVADNARTLAAFETALMREAMRKDAEIEARAEAHARRAWERMARGEDISTRTAARRHGLPPPLHGGA